MQEVSGGSPSSHPHPEPGQGMSGPHILGVSCCKGYLGRRERALSAPPVWCQPHPQQGLLVVGLCCCCCARQGDQPDAGSHVLPVSPSPPVSGVQGWVAAAKGRAELPTHLSSTLPPPPRPGQLDPWL